MGAMNANPERAGATALADLDHELLTTVGVAPEDASAADLMRAVAQRPRHRLAARWVRTQAAERAAKVRRVYYLSMEFLLGRSLANSLDALGVRGEAAEAVRAHASRLEDVEREEPDAALGNGGTGIKLDSIDAQVEASAGAYWLETVPVRLTAEFGDFGEWLARIESYEPKIIVTKVRMAPPEGEGRPGADSVEEEPGGPLALAVELAAIIPKRSPQF